MAWGLPTPSGSFTSHFHHKISYLIFEVEPGTPRSPLFDSPWQIKQIKRPSRPTADASRSRTTIPALFEIRVISRAKPCGLSSILPLIP